MIIFLLGCQGNKNPCSLSDAVLKELNGIDSVINIPEVQEMERNWMKQNYKEPSILHADNETYRCMFRSSFNGTEVYRIEKKDNKYKATIKVFGHHDTIGTCVEFEISKEVWNNITDSLNTTNFWTHQYSTHIKYLDGEGYTLEGYKPIKDKCTLKNYHMIAQASPNDTLFDSMCKLFFRLKPN